MEPMQQQPTQNPYDFLSAQPVQPKKPLFGGSMKARIILVAGVVLVLIIIAVIVSSILSAAGQTTARNLKNVIAQQQELVRVAELGAKDGLSVDARNFAKTISLTVQTDQAKIITMLGRNGGKITPVEQNSAKSGNTDTILEAAKANNQYDNVLVETLTKQLNTYQASLKTAHDGVDGSATKESLSAAFTNAGILLAPASTSE